ncbi:MAG: hypothetical protein MUC65_09340, partial [Pontiellaceae bacterium]|nr:hypothetical protein [Pontiellaceae bacterium]
MKHNRKSVVSALVGGIYFGLIQTALAATHYVNLSNSTPVSPYTSWATAATNIQAAVNVSTNGDTVLVTNGTYLITSEILITNNITVQSVNGPEVTIVDAQGHCYLVFNLGADGCTLSGFTVSGGSEEHGPGAGGIRCSNSDPEIYNCVIRYNFGQGVAGGQVYNCRIHDNSVGISAGAVAYNCLIWGHWLGNDACTMYNCTVVGNTIGSATYDNVTEAFNSIICDNTETNFYHHFGEARGQHIAYNCCSPDLVDGDAGNIASPPLFLSGNRLADNSPCINAGNNDFVGTETDLDGNPRIDRETVDMGAFEYVTLYYKLSVTNGSGSGSYTNGQQV